ncbi:glutathione S-transferase N-terminal domain-containing protein [Kiloniella antarctica]|uniref:Glutathione S-transferase N-terminal domain-containing protein n=1 Tax=Kiloniella antarctica TaxID=1550907 RepID=A0ABW5BEB6_9PROT
MTMQLCFSPTSPYARKVLMVAMEKGLQDEINITPMATFTTESDIWDKNPLGKVPALSTQEGTVLCDSPLICEYLDTLSEALPLIPRSGESRWQASNFHALADGIMDASIQRTVEKRLRPEDKKWEEWHEIQNIKINKALQYFETALTAGKFAKTFGIGEIALACALAYLDFRYADENWRKECPALTTWFEEISKRPSFMKTSPPSGA